MYRLGKLRPRRGNVTGLCGIAHGGIRQKRGQGVSLKTCQTLAGYPRDSEAQPHRAGGRAWRRQTANSELNKVLKVSHGVRAATEESL